MNWTLSGYKTYVGLALIGVGAAMDAAGVEGSGTITMIGSMLAGVGAIHKMKKSGK